MGSGVTRQHCVTAHWISYDCDYILDQNKHFSYLLFVIFIVEIMEQVAQLSYLGKFQFDVYFEADQSLDTQKVKKNNNNNCLSKKILTQNEIKQSLRYFTFDNPAQGEEPNQIVRSEVL